MSPARSSPIRGSPTRVQGSQSLPRAFGVPSRQSTRKNTDATRQNHANNAHRHMAPDFTSVAMLISNQSQQQQHQQPFHTVSSTYRRASIPSASPISHAWGHRVVLNQVAVNPNESSVGYTSGRASRSCAHRQINESAAPLPLSMTVKPLVVDNDLQRLSHCQLQSTVAPALRVTSQSTYRLVPVDNASRLIHQNPPTSPSKPYTSPLVSTVPPPTSVSITRYSHIAGADHIDARLAEECHDSQLAQRRVLEDMVEGPEASESRMYARGRFIYTPEETEVNDNSCISFAY